MSDFGSIYPLSKLLQTICANFSTFIYLYFIHLYIIMGTGHILVLFTNLCWPDLDDLLIGWFIDWLIVHQSIDWSSEWVSKWVSEWVRQWESEGEMTGMAWLIDWLINWLIDWLTGWLTGWRVDRRMEGWKGDWWRDWLVFYAFFCSCKCIMMKAVGKGQKNFFYPQWELFIYTLPANCTGSTKNQRR